MRASDRIDRSHTESGVAMRERQSGSNRSKPLAKQEVRKTVRLNRVENIHVPVAASLGRF